MHILPTDMTASVWDDALHPRADGETGEDGLVQPDIRLGLSRIRGIRKPTAERVEMAHA